MHSVSIVSALYNEVENVCELHAQIKKVCEENNYDYEIIFVDDGSNDGTHKLAKELTPLKYFRFRRNFGQTAAFDAGIKNSTKEYVITIDGDLQNDPADIPKMIQLLVENDLDVVSGWRKDRKDSFAKHFVSRGANLLRKMLINDGIKDSGCSLKVYKRECFKDLTLYGEMHRFIPALLMLRGFLIGEVPVNHRARVAGKTKYNWRRTIRGLIDMVAIRFWDKYSSRPLHLIGGIGLFLVFFGGISGLVTLIQFFMGAEMSDTVWPLLTAFLLFTGIQIFIFGLFADIAFKSYFETTENQQYTIKDSFSND